MVFCDLPPMPPDLRVMFQPSRVYERLLRHPAGGGLWYALRRPLFVACFFGCMVSLMTSARITLRLAGPAAFYWTFVPLLQILALWLLCRVRPGPLSISRIIDLAFLAFGPWLLWLIGFTAVWSFVSPIRAFAWQSAGWFWYGSAWAALAWSCCIDFWFFRRALRRSAAGAIRDVLLHRVLCWGLGLAWFLGSSMWETIASQVGL